MGTRSKSPQFKWGRLYGLFLFVSLHFMHDECEAEFTKDTRRRAIESCKQDGQWVFYTTHSVKFYEVKQQKIFNLNY